MKPAPKVCHLARDLISSALCGEPGWRVRRFMHVAEVKDETHLSRIRNPCLACVRLYRAGDRG